MRFIDELLYFFKKRGGVEGRFEYIFSIIGVFIGLPTGFGTGVALEPFLSFLEDYIGTFLMLLIEIILMFGGVVIVGLLFTFIGYIIDTLLSRL